MANSELSRFVEDPEGKQLFQQERLILDITELMDKALKETGTRRAALAKALGLSRGRITQVLGGDENLTLRTIADVFTAMGKHLATSLEPIDIEPEHWYSMCEKVVTLRKSWPTTTPVDENNAWCTLSELAS